MTDKKPENPPAFPQNEFQKIGDVSEGKCIAGMSLRDYFAAAALSGILTGHLVLPGTPRIAKDEDLAATSYLLADAMLKARE